MLSRTIFGATMIALALALAGCSGAATENSANEAAANATAAYDPASPEAQAYRAVLECGATMQAASSIIGGVSMSKSGAEREQYLADEQRRRGHARALKARAVELGTALGLSAEAIDQQFTAHEGTFVQTAASGSMDQFGATVAQQANTCAANYPDIAP